MRRLGSDGTGRVVSERQRIVLAVLLFLACVGFLLGDATTLSSAAALEPGLAPAGCSDICPRLRWPSSARWRGSSCPGAGGASGRCCRRVRRRRGGSGVCSCVGLFFALLALPVVFAPLQRLVPGLDGMRVPTRSYPFVSFALVFFAARGLDHLLARKQVARRRAILAAVSLVLVARAARRHGLVRVVESRSDPGRLPAHRRCPRRRRGASPADSGLSVRSALHVLLDRALAPDRQRLQRLRAGDLPRGEEARAGRAFEASTLDHLRDLGVTHVAVHPLLFKMSRERKRLLRWERKWGVGPDARLRQVFVDGKDRFWELLPAPSAAPAVN